MENNEIPADLHIIGDEAFCASGNQVLTPYSKRGLRSTKERNPDLYIKQRTFNQILSIQRSTVERAFGMLLRKFIILTRAMSCRRHNIKLIFSVACKLHNLCITHWIFEGNREEYKTPVDDLSNLTEKIISEEYVNHRNVSAFEEKDNPNQPHPWDSSSQGPRRDKLANDIASIGLG